jgi:hypothetical protein
LKLHRSPFRTGLRRQSGAALLLLLAIAGVGAASVLINVFTKFSANLRREHITQMAMAQANDALVGFAITHGRLPRPAISATDGRENPEPCADEASCTGLLPWIALGVSDIDGWNKHLRYSVVPGLTVAPFESLLVIPNKVVLQRGSGGNLSYAFGRDNCTVADPCAPAVIFSYGNRNLGISENNIAQPNTASGNVDEIYNDTATNRFIQRPATVAQDVPGGEFDDQISWLSLRTLYLGMNAAGVLH